MRSCWKDITDQNENLLKPGVSKGGLLGLDNDQLHCWRKLAGAKTGWEGKKGGGVVHQPSHKRYLPWRQPWPGWGLHIPGDQGGDHLHQVTLPHRSARNHCQPLCPSSHPSLLLLLVQAEEAMAEKKAEVDQWRGWIGAFRRLKLRILFVNHISHLSENHLLPVEFHSKAHVMWDS